MVTRDQLKILLIEARLDQYMIDHERKCVARSAGLKLEQIEPLDILPQGPALDAYRGYHAVVLGGTGDYSVVNDQIEFYQPLIEFTRRLFAEGIPTLGLCYGHQIMGQAFGGLVETRHDMAETGTYEMHLTEAGKKDKLLCQLPAHFLAQEGHHDAVLEMPKDWIKLAYSDLCPWEGMRHESRPFYGFQFHPELRREDLHQRMRTYAHVYADTPEKLAEVLDAIGESELGSVVEKFIDELVMPYVNSR